MRVAVPPHCVTVPDGLMVADITVPLEIVEEAVAVHPDALVTVTV